MQIESVNAVIRQKFADAQRIQIASHIRPDGDAIGATLGLGLALRKTGKQVVMTLADGVPASFRHLAGNQLIERNIPADKLALCDLTVVVDVSDLHRIGGVLGSRIPDINIDHHVTNPNFAEINLVIPARAATSAVIAENLLEWGLAFDQDIASALLTGIVTDTIGFRTSNMDPNILRLAAMLMEHGADLPELYARALTSKTFEAARYWGLGLSQMQRVDLPQGGSFVWTHLTLANRKDAEYPGNDDADLVNLLSSIEADLALIFIEQKNGHVKVSWRARPGINVSKIALQFGGGGHPSAAGADIPGSLEIVQQKVLESTQAMLSMVLQNQDLLT